MASLILGTMGKAVLGNLGGAIGAFAGSQIDSVLYSNLSKSSNMASKLGNLRIQSSQYGAPIPKVFGRARLSGQIIWADKFKETTIKRTIGGKGGKKVKEFIYSISFAIGLCEKKISRIGRVWANGELIDINQFEFRLYKGDNENPDPLIEAIMGIDNCPIYKDLAYIVFEDMPLEDFGDKIPQLSFEIIAQNEQITSLENLVNGVCLIPASGEFSYATTPIIEKISKGNEVFINNHQDELKTDFICAIENLENDLPKAKSISLVSAWFGTDINAQNCQIIPKVEANYKETSPRNWKVAGLNRQNASVVSQIAGKNAYGGSIDDNSIIEAIKHLKLKEFKICFNPFIMMDCENYPWRGRIVLGLNNNINGGINALINSFYGNVNANHFLINGENINYIGPDEWSYSRFILHHAALCKAAGGVDSFLIGSEMIGLTRLYNDNFDFPFVDKLIQLAAQVKAILGPDCKISYAADWTEYGAYYVENGNNLFFPCDKLWADSNIDFIAIDYYAPISDNDNSRMLNIIELQENIEGGENYDYFYQNENARISRQQTPIIDNIYNEEWVYRQKDLRNFWGNIHFPRINGMKLANPTPWIAKSKPIRLMELGFPAIDKGGNRPSIFPDAKSSESGIPPFSNGKRNDMEMRNCLFAFLDYWNGNNNPISPIYNGNMIDISNIHIWAWDSRPFPYFPNLLNIWGDGENYEKGHWLMGRVNIASLNAIFEYCLKSLGIENYILENLDIGIDGFVIEKNETPREIFEFLMSAFDIKFRFDDGKIIFFRNLNRQINLNKNEDLITNDDGEIILQNFENEMQATGVSLRYYDENKDYEIVQMQFGEMNKIANFDAPFILNQKQAEYICYNLFEKQTKNIEKANISLGLKYLFKLQINDKIIFENGENWIIENIEIGHNLNLNLRKIEQNFEISNNISVPKNINAPSYFAKPLAFLLDLPAPFIDISNPRPKLYLGMENFAPNLKIYFNDDEIATINQCAKIGYLTQDLKPSSIALKARKPIYVKMRFGQKLTKSGAGAIVNNGKLIEIIEFSDAELIAENTYQLNNIIRDLGGRQNSDFLPQNSDFILIDNSGQLLDISNEFWHQDISCQIISSMHRNQNPQELVLNYNATAQLPWAVCHIRAKRNLDGIKISFSPRSNVGQNSWYNYNNNINSNYEIKIFDMNNNLKNTIYSSVNSVVYSNELQDFLTKQTQMKISVCEINNYGNKGHEALAIINL